MSLILAALMLAGGPAWDDDEGGTDLFQWARDLDALDLTWQWGDFAFAFSGEADLEFFVFGREAPGVTVEDSALRSDRYKRGRFAESPDVAGRLQAFLDGTYKEFLDWSVEARLDGTTAVNGNLSARVEQAWIRLKSGLPELNGEIGKFAAPIGNFIPRSSARKNPLTTWPLAYDHVTTLSNPGDNDAVLVNRREQWDVKDWYVPIWQAVYSWGLMGFGNWNDFGYAVAVTNSGPATLPSEWDEKIGSPKFYTLYLHGSYVVDIRTTVGASWSRGPYEKRELSTAALPPGYPSTDPEGFYQTLAGVDLKFETGHWEVYSEAFWTRLETAKAKDLDLWTWYLEAKYTFTASIFGAARVAQMFFGDAKDAAGGRHQWDRDVTRFEVGGGYLFTANFFLKATVQLNYHMGGREPDDNLLMLQLGLGF